MKKLFELIDRLEKANIFFSMRKSREDAVSIDVAVPGQRWEIDFLKDGSTEIEIFKSDGSIFDDSILFELFDNFSD